jgi:hypothetical protein
MGGFKIELDDYIITWYDDYLIIEDKENEDDEPIIYHVEELDTLLQSTIVSIYPIIRWVIDEGKKLKK